MRRLITFDIGDKAYHTHASSVHPNILTAGSRGRILQAAKLLDSAEDPIENADRGKVVINGTYKGMPVTLFNTGMGTGSVSCTWPEIIEACEHDDMNLIRVGTSGGYDSDYRIGDMVVVDEIYGADSTSVPVLTLLKYLSELYAKSFTEEIKEIPKVSAILKRIGESYDASYKFDRAISKIIDFKEDLDDGKYSTETDEGLRMCLFGAAVSNGLAEQGIYTGATKTTPDIFSNILADSIHESYYPGIFRGTVSMEESALAVYRDFYNLVDGRRIKFASLLMVSDLITGEADNIQDFLSRKEEFESMHIKSGLDGLLQAYY
ncbi:hypothetical protein H6503_05525 [Candidatus Woesearchaeota archaeon]|nr:hypothetical protein [Candidatus Woesearchaeota archaeon]